jgi:hypothetical protein
LSGLSLSLLFWSCATAPETQSLVPAPTLTPAPVPAAEPAPETPCLTECIKQNMARPVAPEIIEADCAMACEKTSGKNHKTLDI